MKKVFLSAALALAVAGSWAFYPKQASQSAYMQLLATYTNGKAELVLVPSEGVATETSVKEANASLARTKLVSKLNELRKDGWRVVQMASSFSSNRAFEETYLLEKL